MPVNPFELAGPGLLAASFAATLSWRWGYRLSLACGLIAAVLALIPFGPASAATAFLGIFGPLSAATLVLLAKGLYALSIKQEAQRWPSSAMLICLAVIGMAFYPLTFGLTDFDPYEFGYRGVAVPALMLLLVFIGWRMRAADILFWVALAALLYTFGAYDSRNLWDYLIVPFDPIYAIGAMAFRFLRPARRSAPA
ncbi:MAG: hypothetical protein ABI830_11495 [Pseudolabrys sp.]